MGSERADLGSLRVDFGSRGIDKGYERNEVRGIKWALEGGKVL